MADQGPANTGHILVTPLGVTPMPPVQALPLPLQAQPGQPAVEGLLAEPLLVNPPGAAFPVPQGPTIAGAATLPVAMRHVIFAFLFCDEAHDPLRHSYAAVIARFDLVGVAPMAAKTLMEIALGNPSIPITYLCCSYLHGGNKCKIYLLHSYPSSSL
jgi:hypothetical protein